MKRALFFAFIVLSIVFIIPNVRAGTSEVWKKCPGDVSIGGSIQFGGTTYYCCDIGWSTSPCPPPGTCYDDDASNDPLVYGTCKGVGGANQPDDCASTTQTKEYYCPLITSTSCSSTTKNCPSGTICQSGVCVTSTIACSDGINNDNDADSSDNPKIDYNPPSGAVKDDGCKSSTDTTECFDNGDVVPGSYETGASKQCCSGSIDWLSMKCIDPSNPCAKYTDDINCNADPDCNWCSGSCQRKACNSCITDKTTCMSGGCAWCKGVCQPPLGGTYAGPCSGANSCPGADVIVDMQKGNEISGCLNQDTQFSLRGGYQAQWWKIKGALGQPVNITFLSNYELSFKLWNITNNCNTLFNYVELADDGKCSVVTYTPVNKCSPGISMLCWGSGVKTCIIDKMPPGGVLVAVDSDCDTPAPYIIEITPNMTSARCG